LDFALDNIDVLCNSEHPEDSRLRPKHVSALIEKLYNVCPFHWFHLKNNYPTLLGGNPGRNTLLRRPCHVWKGLFQINIL
jgi:hypothetical protein